MGSLIAPIRFLNNLEMESVHQAAIQILDEVGMWIDSEEALNYLEDYGCNADYDNLAVRFPPDLVQAAVDLGAFSERHKLQVKTFVETASHPSYRNTLV